ncbi:hypothetical protein ACWDUN_19850 [Mycobacterium sp. NPDC003323]
MMLDEGRPAVEVIAEYAQACRQLGHAAPDPTGLVAAYTAEESMDLAVLESDCQALAALVSAADEALLLQDGARRAVTEAWQGVGADGAGDFLDRHTAASSQTVDGLRCATDALVDLRDQLRRLVEAKVAATLDVEARAMRGEWLSAARIVTTGAGDQSGASELVDQRVAPFVTADVGVDWMSSMRATEDAIRNAYSGAAATAAPPAPAFEMPAGPAGPVAAEGVPSLPGGGGFGGLPSMGSGMSGVSGLGQSFADMLGGLLGAAGGVTPDGLDEPVLDEPVRDQPPEDEPGSDDEEADDEKVEGEEPDESKDLESGAPEDEEPDAEPVDAEIPFGAAEAPPAESAPAPTPVPEPVAAPAPVPPPAEPVTAEPAATPCEIAADELPQAGP